MCRDAKSFVSHDNGTNLKKITLLIICVIFISFCSFSFQQRISLYFTMIFLHMEYGIRKNLCVQIQEVARSRIIDSYQLRMNNNKSKY